MLYLFKPGDEAMVDHFRPIADATGRPIIMKANDHPRALDLHKKLLVLWNAIIADNLPACTRYPMAAGPAGDIAARADAGRFRRPADRAKAARRPSRRGRAVFICP
jgi:hypothetical protein